MENILITRIDSKGPQIELVDFGHSCTLADGQSLKETAGSRFYMSPEILCGCDYNFSTDVWSAMVVIYVLLQGTMPFIGDSFEEMLEDIIETNVKEQIENDERWKHLSQDARSFMKKGFELDKSKRPSVKELMEHPWLADKNPSLH